MSPFLVSNAIFHDDDWLSESYLVQTQEQNCLKPLSHVRMIEFDTKLITADLDIWRSKDDV